MSMSCKDCIFVETLPAMSGGPFNHHQTGCEAGRLEKFKSSEKCSIQDNGFYKLPRFCNMFRHDEWFEDRLDEGLQDRKKIVQAAKDESKLIFGFIVDGASGIEKTMDSIVKLDYDNSKLRVIVSLFFADTTLRQRRDVMDQINIMTKKEDPVMSQMTFHTTKEQEVIDGHCFTPLHGERCSYIAKIKSGAEIDEGYLSYIDRLINDDLKSYTFFEDSNGIEMINTKVINKSYLQFRDYDTMCKELKQMAKTQGSYKRYDKKSEIHN